MSGDITMLESMTDEAFRAHAMFMDVLEAAGVKPREPVTAADVVRRLKEIGHRDRDDRIANLEAAVRSALHILNTSDDALEARRVLNDCLKQ